MWSRIQHTQSAKYARQVMRLNNLPYHNNAHIDYMYAYLRNNAVPYDPALDWAVLFHDIVYDSQPCKEFRSAVMFHRVTENYFDENIHPHTKVRVEELILDTEAHRVSDVNYIIKADLASFLDIELAAQNTMLLLKEAELLYGGSLATRAANQLQFLESFRATMEQNIRFVPSDAQFYRGVVRGINFSVHMLRGIINGTKAVQMV